MFVNWKRGQNTKTNLLLLSSIYWLFLLLGHLATSWTKIIILKFCPPFLDHFMTSVGFQFLPDTKCLLQLWRMSFLCTNKQHNIEKDCGWSTLKKYIAVPCLSVIWVLKPKYQYRDHLVGQLTSAAASSLVRSASSTSLWLLPGKAGDGKLFLPALNLDDQIWKSHPSEASVRTAWESQDIEC